MTRRVSSTAEAAIASVTVDGYQRSSVATLGGSIRLDGDRSAIRADGMMLRFASGSVAAYGDFLGSTLIVRRPVIVALDAEGGAGTYRGGRAGHYISSGFRVGDGSHVVARLAVGRARDTAAYTTLNTSLTGIARIQRAALFATVGATEVRGRLLGSVRIATVLERDRLELTGAMGLQADPSDDPGHRIAWAQAGASVRLTQHLGITLMAGQAPVDIERGIAAARVLSLGIRVSTANLKPVARTVAPMLSETRVEQSTRDGLQQLIILCQGATHIELRGDFTGWQPVALTPAGPGRWTIPIALKPGLYMLAIRVDGGEWRVPPGLSAIADDFGGFNGQLVVR